MGVLTTAKFERDLAYQKEERNRAIMELAKYDGKLFDSRFKQYAVRMLNSGATPSDTLELGTVMLKNNLYFTKEDPEAFMKQIISGVLASPCVKVPLVDRIDDYIEAREEIRLARHG